MLGGSSGWAEINKQAGDVGEASGYGYVCMKEGARSESRRWPTKCTTHTERLGGLTFRCLR